MNLAPDYDVRSVVREMSAGPFLNPLYDHIYVKFVRNEAMFSRLISQHSYGPERDTNGKRIKSTRHIIELNEVGAFFLHNLVCCLMGDHRDPAIYFDSAFSVTLAAIEPNTKMSLREMCTCIEREHPELYTRIKKSYAAWQDPERFGDSADAIRAIFHRHVMANSLGEVHDIVIKLVMRFILGHEIGHYIRDNNRKLRESLETFFDQLEPDVIQNDGELFSDMIAAFHCLEVAKVCKEPIRAQLVVLVMILSFMDAQAATDHKSSGRRTFSGLRFSILIKYFESLEQQEIADELMFLSTDFDSIFLPSISIVREIMDKLSEVAARNRITPKWAMRTSDYIVPRSMSEG